MDHILLEDPELARAFLLESDRQMSVKIHSHCFNEKRKS